MQAANSLLQGIFWRGLYYLAAFVINLLIARHFQASVSGIIYYISSIYAFILLLTSFSFESGIIYFASKKEIEDSKLFNFSLTWSFIIGVLTLVLSFTFFNSAFNDIPAKLIVISSFSFIFGNLLTTYCTALFYARQNFRVPNLINILFTVLLILLIPYNGKSIINIITNENYFYVYFGSFLVQGICIAIIAKIKFVQKNLFSFLNKAQFKKLFRYCALAFIGNIIYFLLYRVDYFFVEKYCTDQQLGNYIQVSKLVQLFFIFPSILAGIVLPITATGNQKNIGKLLSLLSRTIFFIYFLLCALIVLIGKWLFPFVFGASFTSMFQPFLLLVPGILALSGIFTLTAYFAGVNKIRVNITGSLFAFVFILIFDIIFIPIYGINAAALISSLGYIIYQIYIVFVFKKEFKISGLDFFIFKLSDFKTIINSITQVLKNKHENQ